MSRGILIFKIANFYETFLADIQSASLNPFKRRMIFTFAEARLPKAHKNVTKKSPDKTNTMMHLKNFVIVRPTCVRRKKTAPINLPAIKTAQY